MNEDMKSYSKYKAILEKYEANFDDNPIRIMYHMIDLYEDLCDTFFHDLCDSISLWIMESDNEEVLKYIEDKHNPHLKNLRDVLLYKLQN